MDESIDNKCLPFHEMGLDDRLLKAIARLNWSEPTPIQERAIPRALEGRDILARARTGSGKTAAFVIPIIQKILHSKQSAKEQCVKALVMTPSKELCQQAYDNILALCSCCSREVKCVYVIGNESLTAEKPFLMEKPDIVVGTPSRILAHIVAGNLDVKSSLEVVFIDEADLIFCNGYDVDIKDLLRHLPKIYQAFLTSATLSDDVIALKNMVLHNPIKLKLNDSQLPDKDQLMQYHLKCESDEKYVILISLIKLRLLAGKTIIFVNTVDHCYRLKLFLEQFQVASCVLNSQLPANSRCHIVTQFNEGRFDLLIAADEILLDDPRTPKNRQNFNKRKDEESGVARGINFERVSNVINFDFPPDLNAYVHRAGRTARFDNQGTALSFVSSSEQKLLDAIEKEGGLTLQPFLFKMDEVDGFRYRAKDVLRAVTRVAVREARLKEIKSELLNSKKLKSYFEDRPRDLQVLRHDKALHTAKIQPHLQNVPDYLVPQTLRKLARGGRQSRPSRSRAEFKGPSSGQRKFRKRKTNPLISFEFAGLSKKKKRSK